MTVRLFIAAAVLLGIYGGFRWAASRGVPTEPAPLEMKAQDLPTTLGEWKGGDVSLDADVFNAVGAEMVVDRRYQDPRGQAVSLHLAVFEKGGKLQGVPHLPEECFIANGWGLGEPRYLPLDQGGATENVAKLLPLERHGEKGYVLYWYQIEGKTYLNGDGQRRLLLAFRGCPVRPPIVKVMLQTITANPDDAEKNLMSLATEAYKWTRGFH